MALEIVLPMGEKKNVKNIVFSILTKEYPLKLITLTNYIKKRYGISATFQAVRKATLQLVESGVLIKENNEFQINKEWVKESKLIINKLDNDLNSEIKQKPTVDSISNEISVFEFRSINDMMKFWQELIDNWFSKFKKGSHPFNCWQGSHMWEGLMHLETEEKIMGQLKKKGIESYAVLTSNTPLDKSTKKFYEKIGIKTIINSSSSSFDKSYHVGTYGDLIVQTNYPESIVKEFDNFFNKNKSLENYDVTELIKIANKKVKVKLTVIKNFQMAKQINKTIIDQFE